MISLHNNTTTEANVKLQNQRMQRKKAPIDPDKNLIFHESLLDDIALDSY
jgi:hypothetical protein